MKRNYIPHLQAEWQRHFPYRPPKDHFNDEILVAVAFLMHQIDPSGKKPIKCPTQYAGGAEPGPTVKPSRRRRTPE